MKTVNLGPQGITLLLEGDELEILRHLAHVGAAAGDAVQVNGRPVPAPVIQTLLDRLEHSFMEQMCSSVDDHRDRDFECLRPTLRDTPPPVDDDEIPFGRQS